MAHQDPSSHYFTSQGLRLHYADWGNDDAPLLLLIHGSRDHCRSWDWTARLLRKDWHVITPDLRGHGNSAWSPDGDYDRPTLVDDLEQLIFHFGNKPVTIIAHSLGGNVSLRYAGLLPHMVNKLVAIEGLGHAPKMLADRMAIPLAEHWRRWLTARRAAAERHPKHYATVDEAVKRMRAANTSLSEERAQHLTHHGIQRNEDGSWSWKFDSKIYVFPFLDIPLEVLHGLWGAITCPTLLLCGDHSSASNPLTDGRIRHFGQNANVVEIENAGHWVHHDQFDRFMKEILSFI